MFVRLWNIFVLHKLLQWLACFVCGCIFWRSVKKLDMLLMTRIITVHWEEYKVAKIIISDNVNIQWVNCLVERRSDYGGNVLSPPSIPSLFCPFRVLSPKWKKNTLPHEYWFTHLKQRFKSNNISFLWDAWQWNGSSMQERMGNNNTIYKD